jgi:hypothetical protein
MLIPPSIHKYGSLSDGQEELRLQAVHETRMDELKTETAKIQSQLDAIYGANLLNTG